MLVSELVERLLAMPQDKPLVIVDCGADAAWDLLDIRDTDVPDPLADEDDVVERPGVVEILIDTY